ncbi:hypothetical protein SmJEL517_g00947 [Synchytrium microbalum]|uniref:Succinate-semialdehyde dehydrogenase n=1 Tax=Synchytrium microbalum TaxID=1806994 RepID=A0A507CHG2_9FUNG|nr:uncharacterized protein SmJEL517_g00947 [Synchytrium microbalum]TPX37125.1 hypothetical protein SmJEL517_g00947 [Synchytrium microbalum]
MASITIDTKVASKITDKALLKTSAIIGGNWVAAKSGKVYDVVDPATSITVAQVPDMATEDAKAAIEAAKLAFPAWSKLLARERATLLRKWYDLIMANSQDLAAIMVAECGKPMSEAKGEMGYAASFIQWFAEEAPRAYGDVIPQDKHGRRLLVIKQAIGVCGLITPWNFPAAMITRKAGAALAAGCTVVIKPAPETPLSALALVELANRAGIPKGVLNVVTASKQLTPEVGLELSTNPTVRKISFTGSTPVGKLLLKQAASTVKKASMELGGNAAMIIFDDADLDAAVTGVLASKYRNTGQTCVCINRLYVQSKVYDEFASKLAAKVKETLKVGHGFDPSSTVGPLITKEGFTKVKRHVDDAVSKGATAVVGGKPHELGGNFYHPTILTNMSKNMLIHEEETFGPVAALFKFETEEEVVALANATPFGLAGYFYSNNISRIFRVAEAIECGMVGINDGMISNEVAPFGGIKESGLGREGSKYGLAEYMEDKYLAFGNIVESKL